MSDLAQFFGVVGGIILGLVLLLSCGYAQAEKRYGREVRASIRMLDAKISDYVAQKWNEGGR